MITEDGDFYVRWCPVSSRLDEKAESNPLARWSRLGKLDAYGKDNTDVTERKRNPSALISVDKEIHVLCTRQLPRDCTGSA